MTDRTALEPWPEAVERVAAFLRAAGGEARLEEFDETTTTAEAAADALGCTLGQIVKSLVLVCDGRPVLALVPGDRRADLRRVAAAVEVRRARIARTEEVVAATGFEPGGVAPFPLVGVEHVLLERRLLRHRTVWCGAGSERHMAGMTPDELARLTRAVVADVAASAE
jgi:prolyl-tRNA editing enzyme YbaK/EbsC (Cys-tRNA(Pro) deacylase)